MSENTQLTYKRWYEEDPVVTRCLTLLEGLDDSMKRQTATYIMDEIINKPPYTEMLPEEVFNLVLSETRKRRWYDFDEVTRIFIEMLRHSPSDIRRQISVQCIKFVEGIMPA